MCFVCDCVCVCVCVLFCFNVFVDVACDVLCDAVRFVCCFCVLFHVGVCYVTTVFMCVMRLSCIV